jgi:hypothetical protein
MADRRYRQSHLDRREERALRQRWARLLAAGGAPLPDPPIELAPERVCVQTGALLDRRGRVRGHPTR